MKDAPIADFSRFEGLGAGHRARDRVKPQGPCIQAQKLTAMLFAFKARDAGGEVRTGSLEGATANDVARLLVRRGLQPLEVTPAPAGTASGRLSMPVAAPDPTPPPVQSRQAEVGQPASAQTELEKILSVPPPTEQPARPIPAPIQPAESKRASSQPERRAADPPFRPAPALPASSPAPVRQSLYERFHATRVLGALAALAALLVVTVGVVRSLGRENHYQLVVTGRVELSRSDSAPPPSLLNTKVYVFFPELGRALRPDGRQYVQQGEQWILHPDPASKYDIWWKNGVFELRATVSGYAPPTVCRVTVRKLGYIRYRSAEFPLRAAPSGLLTGEAPAVTLVPSGQGSEATRSEEAP